MANYYKESMEETTTITIHDVPEWLKNSERYFKLFEEEEYTVPTRLFIQNPIINWIEDFRNVIETIQFWGVSKIPYSVFLFTIYHHSQGYQHVKELLPYSNIWRKLDIFVSYIEELNLIMDMVNLSASSRTIFPLMIRLSKHGFIDCIEFCLSLFSDDKEEIKYLLNSEIYISLIKSKLTSKEKIKALKKLKKLGFPLCHTSSIIEENTEANPDCLLWLHKNGATLDSSTLKKVISTGPLKNTIRFLLNHVSVDDDIMEHACHKNNIEAVKMFIERDCSCNKNSFFRAIENSNLLMIKILLDYIPCEAIGSAEELIEKALGFGDFLCLKYLHQNGISWGKRAYEFLELIRENGNFTENHEACLRYLNNH